MLLSNSLTCKFEEVYQNGDLQIGQIFIQDSKIRYQYQNQDLYTLIYKANNLYFIRNREPDKFEKIIKNKNLFAEIMKIYNDFPDIELKQQFDGLSITLELNQKKKFIKRMGIFLKIWHYQFILLTVIIAQSQIIILNITLFKRYHFNCLNFLQIVILLKKYHLLLNQKGLMTTYDQKNKDFFHLKISFPIKV